MLAIRYYKMLWCLFWFRFRKKHIDLGLDTVALMRRIDNVRGIDSSRLQNLILGFASFWFPSLGVTSAENSLSVHPYQLVLDAVLEIPSTVHLIPCSYPPTTLSNVKQPHIIDSHRIFPLSAFLGMCTSYFCLKAKAVPFGQMHPITIFKTKKGST